MKHVSSDKYGIVIKSEDDKFTETFVKNLYLLEVGAYDVQEIYYRDSNLVRKTPIFEKKFIGAGDSEQQFSLL